jgi:hypothetical protein
LQLDKNRERHSEKTFDAEIEDETHVHVASFIGCSLTRGFSVVGEGNLKVVVITALLV